MIKSNKSGEIERLARLVTIQKLLHDPKPLGAETCGKYSKENQKLWATCDYLPSLFAFCSLFLWGFAGGPPGSDPKGFLPYTSPIY
jgi:hypothetical protein